MNNLVFNKEQFCTVAQNTVIYILTAAGLAMLKDKQRQEMIPRMKSRDYIEYFFLDMSYQMYGKNINYLRSMIPSDNIYHALYLVGTKSLLDYGLQNNARLMDNAISIGASEGVSLLVDNIRGRL